MLGDEAAKRLLVTGHVWEQTPAMQRTLFEVNTLGTINGTLAALELMRPANRGHVINVVSLAGLGAPPGEALYAATKHGAMAFTLGALADLRRKRANARSVFMNLATIGTTSFAGSRVRPPCPLSASA